MAPTRVILMSCGSYNPPTNMHLRMFEIARDYLHRMGTHIVVGGVISPVHDAYAKMELAGASHRCAMLRLALQNSDWIRLSTWETRQNGWTKTKISLQHHQNLLNSVLFDPNNAKHHIPPEDLEWIPENVRNSSDTTPIQIKLLCGADLLESFGTYNLWAEEDIDAIVGEHGLLVITREGCDPNKFIYYSDILSKHMHQIYIVTEWIPNEVSSTRIRRALKRGESVRYLVQDSVIDYIYEQGIYDAKTTTARIKLELTSPNANNYLTIDPKYQNNYLTPSPSDVTMESPSPVEIITIDVPDAVLRKNIQNAGPASGATLKQGLDEAREKFINAFVTEKSLGSGKAAYPGLAKQIIATETGESQILDEVGDRDDDDDDDRNTVDKGTSTRVSMIQGHADEGAVGSAGSSRVEDKEGGGDTRVEESCLAVCKAPVVSSSSLSVDSSGRHEGALSDFSVDKEHYRLTRYGLDREDLEDEVRGCFDRSCDREGREGKDGDTVENTVVEEDINPGDGVRCSNAQVLVLVSAMIHNNLEKETATLIVEENDIRGKGEITIIKSAETEGGGEKLSFIVQSPLGIPSEESSVKIQEITEDTPEDNSKEKLDESESLASDKKSVKRDSNLEIDGKYIKSVVNSRKSPRKARTSQIRLFNGDGDFVEPVECQTEASKVFQKPPKASSRSKSPRKEKTSRSNARKSTSEARILDGEERPKRGQKDRYDGALKGSLDSVIGKGDARTASRLKARATEDSFTKKSKSYESIKKIQEVYQEEPSRTDSTSKLMTANDFTDLQTDEYCSVCCYATEMSLRTDGSPTQETFYTLRSNCSSFADEDLTECDICSSWNLQESTEALDRKLLIGTAETDPLCEVCEICGEIGAAFEPPGEDSILSSLRDPRDYVNARPNDTRNLSKDGFRISDSVGTDPTSLEDDSFEIENCGFQSATEDDRGFFLVEGETPANTEKQSSRPALTPKAKRDKYLVPKDKYFVPKDEVEILTTKRIGRKGSLMRKNLDDQSTNPSSQDKRRYSSVDNLQLAKVSARNNEKFGQKPRNNKLIGSADNIRTRDTSRRCKSLQRSADNVRYLDSSVDNLDSLVESLGKEDEAQDSIHWTTRPNIRDNETVKMILTKHGIKIISEKETAL